MRSKDCGSRTNKSELHLLSWSTIRFCRQLELISCKLPAADFLTLVFAPDLHLFVGPTRHALLCDFMNQAYTISIYILTNISLLFMLTILVQMNPSPFLPSSPLSLLFLRVSSTRLFLHGKTFNETEYTPVQSYVSVHGSGLENLVSST